MSQQCTRCRRLVDHELHEIDSNRSYCDDCYDEYKMDQFVKSDTKSKRLVKLNFILSMLGNCASAAFLIGLIMLFGTKRITGIWIIAISSVIIASSVFLSFAIDHAINNRIKLLNADVKLKPMFWDTDE